MSCSTLIGVATSGGAYTAHWLHWGGDPATMLPLLRRVWQHTFDRHTLTTIEAVVGHRWVAVDATAAGSGRHHSGRPVPGIGIAADLTDGVRRDTDGRLLLDVPLSDWSWWLLPDPAEGERR